jgi:hypothetical protein
MSSVSGQKFKVPVAGNEVVYRALDLEGAELIEEHADEAGTRHRAACRLSRRHQECIDYRRFARRRRQVCG